MDNYYYFFRSSYQLWPYSRHSQTTNEEGNVLYGDHPVITDRPCAKEWQIPLQSVSLCNLFSPDTMAQGTAWSLQERGRISFPPASQSVPGKWFNHCALFKYWKEMPPQRAALRTSYTLISY